MKIVLKVLFLSLAMLLASCAPAAGDLTVEPPLSGTATSPSSVETPATMDTPIPGEPVESAREALAYGLDIPAEEVSVIRSENVEWPNACLGVELPETACAEVLVSGQRVVLEANGQQFEYHTGMSGDQVVLAGVPDSGDENLELVWSRTGGVAGFCDQLRIFQGGIAQALDCNGRVVQPGDILVLSDQQMDEFQGWIEAYDDFTIQHTDPATADAMTIQLHFIGSGTGQPGEQEKQTILDFSQNIYSEITR